MKPNMKSEMIRNIKKTAMKVTTAAVTLAMALVFGSTTEARDRHDHRQTRQRARVHEGAQSGELNSAEMHRLHKSKRAIRRTEKRFQNNDGTIGDKEAAVLEQMQDSRSRQIHRLKNNDVSRDDGPRSGAPPSTPAN